jgi:hypothetical protein
VATDKDLIDKADALLRRINAPATGSDTGAVPVLTDLVDSPGQENAPPQEGDIDADRLREEICNRLMAEVEARLAADLKRRLAEHLAPQLNAAVASAMDDLREQLANAIGEAVTEALKARPVK